ncbi:SirB2 family protein [Roseateles koreensis]|uniref:SirB2 family protein n=1 Tax=Roseateles koreensis TaxID=2987526 RepID=A0ABT5KZ86_9BURK|nr:SirB2 family protein [Roseateles koreensis]MDC8787042.1 SirB2 family protein [Roseateles koreensis]
MDWFSDGMRQTHVALAWFSVLLFLVRGLAVQFGANWPLDSRFSVLVFCADTLLTVTGLSLWVLLYYSPLRDAWLALKLLALVGYTACAYLAMGKGEFRSLAYLYALLMLAYMMGVSYTREPLLGL